MSAHSLRQKGHMDLVMADVAVGAARLEAVRREQPLHVRDREGRKPDARTARTATRNRPAQRGEEKAATIGIFDERPGFAQRIGMQRNNISDDEPSAEPQFRRGEIHRRCALRQRQMLEQRVEQNHVQDASGSACTCASLRILIFGLDAWRWRNAA